MATEFTSAEVGVEVADHNGLKTGALFFYVKGQYEETTTNIKVSFKSIVKYTSGDPNNPVLTSGSGFRFYPGYKVVYDNQVVSDFITDKNSFETYDFFSNGYTGMQVLPYKDTPSESPEWTITIDKKSDVGGEIQLVTYLRGNHYPKDTVDVALPFFNYNNGSKIDLAVDSTLSPYVITFEKSVSTPKNAFITSLVYPTPEKPTSITIDWEYGEINADFSNAPTNCQLWIKNSQSGDNWSEEDNASVLTYTLDKEDISTWPRSYLHELKPNEKYKYMIRVWNETGEVVDSEPSNGWIYSQPAPPILTQVYSKGKDVFYNISTDNVLVYSSSDFTTDSTRYTDVYWRANSLLNWKSVKTEPIEKINSTDIIELYPCASFTQGNGFISSDDYNLTKIYKVPNIYTPWIKV